MIVGRQRLQTAPSYFQPLQLYQGGLILLSAFVLWQCGVMAGAKARARSALPQLSVFPFTSTHQSTHPPTHPPIYPSTHVLLIHPFTHSSRPPHLPIPPFIHPSFHPSTLLLSSCSNSFPLCSLLIYHVSGTTLGPRILAHSLVMETEHHHCGGVSRAVSWGPSREFMGGTSYLGRELAWTRAQRQEEGQQEARSCV